MWMVELSQHSCLWLIKNMAWIRSLQINPKVCPCWANLRMGGSLGFGGCLFPLKLLGFAEFLRCVPLYSQKKLGETQEEGGEVLYCPLLISEHGWEKSNNNTSSQAFSNILSWNFPLTHCAELLRFNPVLSWDSADLCGQFRCLRIREFLFLMGANLL